MKILLTVLINALALFVVSLVLDGFQFEGGWIAPVIVGVIITVLNLIVKPFIKLLSFPLIFFTGGLFLIVINALILYLANYLLNIIDISGVAMHVENTLTYVFAAIIFGLANWFLHWAIKE